MHNQPGGAPPVFVDRSGKRRRLTIIAGTAMGLGLLTSLGLIAAGLFGGSSVSLPGWADPKGQPPIEAGVDESDELDEAVRSPTPRPSPVTSSAVPVPTTSRPAGAGTSTVPAARPSSSDVPGQGDERRTAKPSKSPGKPN